MTASSPPIEGLCFLLLLVMAGSASAGDNSYNYTGHTKLNAVAISYPDNSLLRDAYGASSVSWQGDLRLNFGWQSSGWSAEVNYQLVAADSEQLRTNSVLPPTTGVVARRLPNDDRRLMNLTDVIREAGDFTLLQRLDRLWLGYSSERLVLRIGRQALSWGNGVFYTPLDLVNPFDPSSIDTEYKMGDDMLYAQYLRASGDDAQAALVVRRDPLTGDVDADEATATVKYRGFASAFEYDLLLADNYGDTVFGIGLSRGLGGAVAGADLAVTRTADSTFIELVANLSYSWNLFDRNMSGVLEYYFNEFGLSGDYRIANIAAHPELAARLARGQQFTVGRHYLAGSVNIELTPLWSFAPVLLTNLEDPSALLQLTSNYSLSDNMTLLGNINIPIGRNGTEFAGLPTGLPDRYLSTGPALFIQWAWYF
jgi:hypothetical protein